MAKTKNPEILKKKERVRAAVDLLGVPEGTEGRIIISNGFDWIRYWVAFDNGMEVGSLHRDKLVRTSEWKQYLADREYKLANPDTAEAGGADEAAADGGGDAGGGVVVNGVTVPQLLIDRSKAALERFGVTR